MTADFDSLKQQFLGHWSQIEQAAPADRRILTVELAKALAEWEAAQTPPLESRSTLKRTAQWSALAQTAAAASAGIVERLGEEKQALRDRLQITRAQIQEAERQLQTLTPEVEKIGAELSLGEFHLGELAQRETALRQQLDACLMLRDLQTEVAGIRAELGLLDGSLGEGRDPGDVLTRLAGMGHALVDYYDAYVAATRDIATHLASDAGAGAGAPPAREVLDVPGRLLAMDRELKAIDQTLAGHLGRQDALDHEIKARV